MEMQGGLMANMLKPNEVQQAHHTIMAVLLEAGGVAVLVLLAGSGKDAGNIAVLLLTGFWLLFAVTNPGVIKKLMGQFESNIQKG
jgi:hypothetical protein